MTDPTEQPAAGFTWDDYVGELVAQEGSLTAVAERLAATRAYADDVGSIERALRRLRARGQRAGGKWGTALLALFGLPANVLERLHWMAVYHSRFSDLPVALCDDLVRLWDHPPTTERRESRAWLALARASIALRKNDEARASELLALAKADLSAAPVEAQLEATLVRAYLASKHEPSLVPELLSEVAAGLEQVASPDERACLRARWTDQSAYDLNRGREGQAPDHAAAEALYRGLPSENVPPFVLCRRASGLSYVRWKQGAAAEAAQLAREAAAHAGDGGHVRLRVMALNLLSRIDPSETGARDRALAMSRRIQDELLLARMRPRT